MEQMSFWPKTSIGAAWGRKTKNVSNAPTRRRAEVRGLGVGIKYLPLLSFINYYWAMWSRFCQCCSWQCFLPFPTIKRHLPHQPTAQGKVPIQFIYYWDEPLVIRTDTEYSFTLSYLYWFLLTFMLNSNKDS